MQETCVIGRRASKTNCCRYLLIRGRMRPLKARYVFNLYAAGLSPEDSRHRELVTAILEDFLRLAGGD
jgi:hypothetical protein